jgi:hypothetical protein
MFQGKQLRVNFGKSHDTLGDEEDELLASPLSGPPQPPAPANPKLKDIIDKLANYVVKHGPHMEDITRERQANNPHFSFLNEGGEYYEYYKWKIYDTRQLQKLSETPWQQAKNRIFTPPPASGAPLSDSDKALLSQILDTLQPTKDSIKRGKDFVMGNPDSASAIAQFMCMRVQQTPDFTARLNIIYLANDVLHHSVKSQQNEVKGPFIDAILLYLPSILYTTFQNQTPENQLKVSKLLGIWKTKQIYEESKILELEADMKGESLRQPVSNSPPDSENSQWMESQVPPQQNRVLPQHQQQPGSYHAVPPPTALNPPAVQTGPPQQQQGNRLMNNLDSLIASSRNKSETSSTSSRQSEGRSSNKERSSRDDREYERNDRDYERSDRDRERRSDRDRERGDRDRERGDRERDRDRDHDRDYRRDRTEERERKRRRSSSRERKK